VFRVHGIEIDLVVEDWNGDESFEEEYQFSMTNPNSFEKVWTDLEVAPYSIEQIYIDCHGTMDPSKWTLKNIQFGKSGN
jgi:hypothetical protein